MHITCKIKIILDLCHDRWLNVSSVCLCSNSAYNAMFAHNRPTNCPNSLYGIMSGCLNHNSEDRPGFKDVVFHLVEANSRDFSVQAWFSIYYVGHNIVFLESVMSLGKVLCLSVYFNFSNNCTCTVREQYPSFSWKCMYMKFYLMLRLNFLICIYIATKHYCVSLAMYYVL